MAAQAQAQAPPPPEGPSAREEELLSQLLELQRQLQVLITPPLQRDNR